MNPAAEPGEPAGPAEPVDWARWTVILLKPDCLARDLVYPVLAVIEQHLQVVKVRTIRPTEQQIFTHYDDILPLSAQLGRDVPAELRRIYVGHRAALALAHGPAAAPRLRDLLGPTDPAQAAPDTIRGRFGTDTLPRAQAEGRLVDNLIHSSDTIEAVPRDFDLWYGPASRHLLRAPLPHRGDR